VTRPRSLLKDERGVAAVEFALLAPFLMLLYFGLVEFVQAYQAQKRVSHVAMTIADVTSQDRVTTDAKLTDILEAGVALMTPFPQSNLRERVSSLTANSSGVVSVDWTANRNWTGGSAPTVPAGFLNPGESAIVTDVIYTYNPTYTLVMTAPITMTRHAYVRPRLTEQVQKQ
jgi:Flp pilus assembly protein TadG